MIKLYGKKLTANEYAKRMVFERGETAHYWQEFMDDVYENATAKEIEDINKAVDKHVTRLYKFIGMDKIKK